MLAYLKVLLILAARLKSPKAGVCGPGATDLRHPVLVQLRDLIEQNYHTWHSPAGHAKRLHITAKTLGRIVREHLATTPTDFIRNRIHSHEVEFFVQVVLLVAQRLRVAEAIGTEQERAVHRHGALQAVGEELLAVGDVADHFERTPLAGDGP